jgi:hypothetical protein
LRWGGGQAASFGVRGFGPRNPGVRAEDGARGGGAGERRPRDRPAEPSGRREAAEIEAELRSYLTDWQRLLRGKTLQARQMIRKFLIGRLIFTPDEDERGRFYTYEGHVDRMQPIRGTVLARAMVTPAGFAGASTVELRGVIRIA